MVQKKNKKKPRSYLYNMTRNEVTIIDAYDLRTVLLTKKIFLLKKV